MLTPASVRVQLPERTHSSQFLTLRDETVTVSSLCHPRVGNIPSPTLRPLTLTEWGATTYEKGGESRSRSHPTLHPSGRSKSFGLNMSAGTHPQCGSVAAAVAQPRSSFFFFSSRS